MVEILEVYMYRGWLYSVILLFAADILCLLFIKIFRRTQKLVPVHIMPISMQIGNLVHNLPNGMKVGNSIINALITYQAYMCAVDSYKTGIFDMLSKQFWSTYNLI